MTKPKKKEDLLEVGRHFFDAKTEEDEKNILSELEKVFRLGGTDVEACLSAKISTASLYRFQEKNPAFSERKQILKSSSVLIARQEVVRGLKGNPEFALKYLERKKKDEFSTRTDITSGDEPINAVVNWGEKKK